MPTGRLVDALSAQQTVISAGERRYIKTPLRNDTIRNRQAEEPRELSYCNYLTINNKGTNMPGYSGEFRLTGG